MLQEDAMAVLGGSDDRNCTYDTGYVYRQALYSCLTCVPKTSPDPAGVCLACSLTCHDGHELVELYTKRNFRCDCGNSKFENFVCRLRPNKDATNEKNKYNHNFVGEYCTCNRPYPDPEENVDDEMIQCVMCEDWFHSQHLDATAPDGDEFSEMICQSCVDRCPFLRSYARLTGEEKDGTANGKDLSLDMTGKEEKTSACTYFNMSVAVSGKGALFFTDGWRDRLCRCEQCLEMYEVHSCSFLIDGNDTVQHYEELGKVLHESGSFDSQNSLMRVFSQQDQSAQREMAYAYNEFKEELTNYLNAFAEKRKVVQEEDIHEFFNALRARKRPRTMPGGSCNNGASGSSSQ